MGHKNIVIKADGISKIYRLGVKEDSNENLINTFLNVIRYPYKNYKKFKSLYNFDDVIKNQGRDDGVVASTDIIWALRDVSFEIEKGEAVGIIGTNGSGKSTLLKILSQITSPTGGIAQVAGTISSLLEVGTGFHPELTGRENVFLNGTILGMTTKEIRNKFDAIVEFSGLEKYIDTPVKRYSSGMAVRLAFSVAAHLDPDILLIDEVLAVGDVAFQEKCLGTMDSQAKSGKTILFVSHNMAAINQLCQRVIWINKGKLIMIGPSEKVVSEYLKSHLAAKSKWQDQEGPNDQKKFKCRSVTVLSNECKPVSLVKYGDDINIEIVYELFQPIRNLSIAFHVSNSQGVLIFESLDTDCLKHELRKKSPGTYKSICKIPKNLLMPGKYRLTVVSFVMNVTIFEQIDNVVEFDVANIDYFHEGRRGLVAPRLDWNAQMVDSR